MRHKRKEGHVKMEAETGVMLLQAKGLEHKAGKGKDRFSLEPLEEIVAPSEVDLIPGLPDYERLSSHCF